MKYESFTDLKSLIKKLSLEIKTDKKITHKTILFSPSAASFDNFKNFEDVEDEYILENWNYDPLTKKILQSISGINSTENLKDIGKYELYINKTSKALETFISETDKQNVELAKDLQKKYGSGTINPEKGTFIPDSL